MASKYKSLCEILRRRVETEFTAGAKFPTQRALMAEYRVSLATVERALRELVADGLLIRSQGRGTFVRRKTELRRPAGHQIALLLARNVTCNAHAFYAEILFEINNKLSAAGCSFAYFYADESTSPHKLIRHLTEEEHFQGAILINRIPEEIAIQFQQSGFPFVVVDNRIELPGICCVTGDNEGGAAAMVGIDSKMKGILFWRNMTNWLGGMGLLLLTISLFPVLGAEGLKMASAEVPGPRFEKIAARISDTAKIIYIIYISMTVIEFLLLPSGLTPFESLINTMSTISTAGVFNLNNDVILNFSPYVKTIFTIFSIAGSVNFFMYFYLFQRKWKRAFGNIEILTYLGLLAGASVVIALSLYFGGYYSSILGALGDAFAQAVAFGSTSGYEISNINLWPTSAKMILLILVLIGGCANSTSGSIKVIRFIIYFKLIFRGIYKRIHPRAVKPVMIQGNPVSAAVVSSVAGFVLLYFAVLVFSCLVFSLENLDMETTFSTAVACITNNGTAFGELAGGNFSFFSGFGKFCAAVLMMAGRLELYAIILLFSRTFWFPDRVNS